MSLRRPTNHDGSNNTQTPFMGCGCTATGATRNCMTCGKWRPQAGGRTNTRTKLWQCASCVAVQLIPPLQGAA